MSGSLQKRTQIRAYSREVPGSGHPDRNERRHVSGLRSLTANMLVVYLKPTDSARARENRPRPLPGTVLAAMALNEMKSFDSAAQAKRNLRAAIENVAARLGNTPTICRKCYVHPDVLTSYLDGKLILEIKQAVEKELRDALPGLQPEEAAVLAILRERLAKEAIRGRDKPVRAA